MAKTQSSKSGFAHQPKPNNSNSNSNSNQAKNTAKQGKSSSSAPALVVPNRDLFHRVNFTHQASIFLQSLALGAGAEGSSSRVSRDDPDLSEVRQSQSAKRKGKGKGRVEEVDLSKLARKGMEECKKMSVHTQLKLDPSLKRSICKECSTVLVPGLTSKIRNRHSRQFFNITHQTCLHCQTRLSIPNPPIHSNSNTQNEDDDRLDGSVRRAKRRKAARKALPFHEREKGSNQDKDRGHELWFGDQRLEGWGGGEGSVHQTMEVKR